MRTFCQHEFLETKRYQIVRNATLLWRQDPTHPYTHGSRRDVGGAQQGRAGWTHGHMIIDRLMPNTKAKENKHRGPRPWPETAEHDTRRFSTPCRRPFTSRRWPMDRLFTESDYSATRRGRQYIYFVCIKSIHFQKGFGEIFPTLP